MTTTDLRLYPMVPVGVALVVGILFGDACYGVVSVSVLLWLLFLLLVVAMLAMSRRVVSMVVLLVATVVLGMMRGVGARSTISIPLPEEEVEYEAVIASEPVPHGKVVQMDLLVMMPDGTLPVRASLLRDTVANNYTHLHVGSGIRAFSRLECEHRMLRTFIFYRNWEDAAVDLRQMSLLQRARLRLMRLRQGLANVLDDHAVARAMVLGDKSLLTRELRNDYTASGVSHLLALSGLHLGIIYALLSLVTFRMRRHWLGQTLILSAVWGYVLLVGMMPSVVRSACMLTVYSVAGMIGRDRLLVNTWAVAAVVMLLVSPQSLWDVGFQMSFLAVLSILLLLPMVLQMRFFLPFLSSRVGRWALGMLAVTFAAQIGTAPLVAHVFGRVAPYGLLANFVAVPLATAMVAVAVACLCLFWLPLVSEWLRVLLCWLGDLLNGVAGFVASLPGASVEVSLSLWQTLACYMLLLALFLLAKVFIPNDSFQLTNYQSR